MKKLRLLVITVLLSVLQIQAADAIVENIKSILEASQDESGKQLAIARSSEPQAMLVGAQAAPARAQRSNFKDAPQHIKSSIVQSYEHIDAGFWSCMFPQHVKAIVSAAAQAPYQTSAHASQARSTGAANQQNRVGQQTQQQLLLAAKKSD